MPSIEYTYEDEANNRTLDMEIEFSIEPYVPTRMYPVDLSHPAEGGGVDNCSFYIHTITTFDEDGNELEARSLIDKTLSQKDADKLSDEIYRLDKDFHNFIEKLCLEEAEKIEESAAANVADRDFDSWRDRQYDY